MKHSILIYFCLSLSYIIFGSESERANLKNSDTTKTKTKRSTEFIRENTLQRETADIGKKTGLSKTKTTIPEQVTHTEFERNLEDAHKIRMNKKLSPEEKYAQEQKELQKARDKYRQRYNDRLSTHEFLKVNIDSDHMTSIYKSDLDTSSKEFSSDLYDIDPHLFAEYNNQAYAIKTKAEKLTTADFTAFEIHPKLLVDTTSYISGELSGRKLRPTPLEEAIELKDANAIRKIFKIIRNPSVIKKAKEEGVDISIESLTQPLLDKYIDLFHKGGIEAAEEYFRSIQNIGSPELTKTLNEQTAVLYFQWSLGANDIAVAKNVLSHVKNLGISEFFIADQLVDRYNYLLKYKSKKEASQYLSAIHQLGDDALYADLYYKLFPAE